MATWFLIHRKYLPFSNTELDMVNGRISTTDNLNTFSEVI